MAKDKQFTEEKYKGFEDIPVRSAETQAAPQDVSFNPEKIKTLDRHFLGLIKNNDLQGASYLLARKGKIFAWKAMGTLDYEKGGPYQPDSIRWIASMTKMFTAVSIIRLYERGMLNIFEPVALILKEFDTDMHKSITPYHLLTNTSGLRADGGYFNEPYMQAWNENLNNWIESYLAGPVQSQPGEKWSYSSMGYAVLGEIICRLTGLDITDYIDQHILKPLKMDDSGFYVPTDKLDRLCLATEWERKRILTEPVTDQKGHPPPAGGGMVSTLHDMYRFGQCLLNNGTLDGVKILSRKAIEFIGDLQFKDLPAYHWGGNITDMKYGVGFSVFKDDFSNHLTFGHEGAGFCGLYIDRKNELVYMFYVPSDIGWTAESVDCPRAIVWSGIDSN